MRQITKSLLLTCFFVFLSQPVLAEDDEVSIVGGVAYNLKNEDFDIAGKPFKPEFVTLEWSVIAAYKSSYVKFSFDQSIKDFATIDNAPNSGGNIDNQTILFSRKDISLTFGYSVLDNMSIFVGYTRGETSGTGIAGYRFEGGIAFPDDAIISNLSISIKESGPFVGASYSYYLQDSGSFSFSLAYAQLDGEVSILTTATSVANGAVTFDSQVAKGDADGISYSVTWTDQFSEDTLYNISLKTTNYKFDAPEIPGEDSFDFDDTYNIFSIGFSKFF
jgi:hypothetical protein